MKIKSSSLLVILIIFLIFACEDKKSEEVDDPNFDTPDWTDETHGKGGELNYGIVFPLDKVNRIDVVISKENWKKMMDDMTANWGPFGQGGQRPGDFADENPIWVPCDLIFEEKQWYKVGIRFKGNSSLGFAWHRGKWKIPLKLDFDEYEDDY